MRVFGGMPHTEIAAVLEISVPTVERDMRMARAWLRSELQPASGEGHRSAEVGDLRNAGAVTPHRAASLGPADWLHPNWA
jgi:hypothetical protein